MALAGPPAITTRMPPAYLPGIIGWCDDGASGRAAIAEGSMAHLGPGSSRADCRRRHRGRPGWRACSREAVGGVGGQHLVRFVPCAVPDAQGDRHCRSPLARSGPAAFPMPEASRAATLSRPCDRRSTPATPAISAPDAPWCPGPR